MISNHSTTKFGEMHMGVGEKKITLETRGYKGRSGALLLPPLATSLFFAASELASTSISIHVLAAVAAAAAAAATASATPYPTPLNMIAIHNHANVATLCNKTIRINITHDVITLWKIIDKNYRFYCAKMAVGCFRINRYRFRTEPN